MSWTAWYGGHFSWRSLSNKWNYERLDVVMKHKSIWLVHAPVSCCVVHAKAAPWQRVFVVLSMSTLTSPLSPSLFSPIDDLRCSDLVTSDEEPDLGAFTAVLRAWGYLLPPLRIHATTVHDSSSASDSPRSVEINSEVDVFSPSSELVAASTLVNDNTTESDIIMAYSPSTDQPVLDFLRPRRLRIHAQPLRPLPSFIVDDTSSPLPCLQDMALSSVPSQSDQIPISQADQPSLGYLDEALSFIAQERARWSAARLNRASNNRLQTFGSESTSADDFEHEYEYEYEHEHDMNAYDETLGYTIGDYLPFLWVFSLLDSCHVMLST